MSNVCFVFTFSFHHVGGVNLHAIDASLLSMISMDAARRAVGLPGQRPGDARSITGTLASMLRTSTSRASHTKTTY